MAMHGPHAIHPMAHKAGGKVTAKHHHVTVHHEPGVKHHVHVHHVHHGKKGKYCSGGKVMD